MPGEKVLADPPDAGPAVEGPAGADLGQRLEEALEELAGTLDVEVGYLAKAACRDQSWVFKDQFQSALRPMPA